LDDYPRWAVFLELKVGTEEGTQQTTTYATADAWRFNWFGTDTIAVEELEDTKYVYVKRDVADSPNDDTGTFEAVSWTTLVEWFETETQDSLFEYPNRSVIQFTDFIQSLKRTEDMDSSIEEDELNERLDLYFEYSDLIERVEQADSQFESDFEDVSTYLTDNWETQLTKNTTSRHRGGKPPPEATRSGRRFSPSTGIRIRSIAEAPSNCITDIHRRPRTFGTGSFVSGSDSPRSGTSIQRSDTKANRSTTYSLTSARQSTQSPLSVRWPAST
jgi:hypothetical protein